MAPASPPFYESVNRRPPPISNNYHPTSFFCPSIPPRFRRAAIWQQRLTTVRAEVQSLISWPILFAFLKSTPSHLQEPLTANKRQIRTQLSLPPSLWKAKTWK